ncbi:MAG: bacterial Ig-like domain-containing protein [Clostridia bacterium]|nr:bacterial Ig-like domain-containing protein [Clostridia bacterium]
MKKSIRFLTFLFLMACVCLMAVACDDRKTTTTTTEPQGPQLELGNPEILACDLGAEFNVSDIIVKLVDGDTVTTLAQTEYTVSGTVDTTAVGEYELTITYGELTLDLTVTVSAPYEIDAFDLPEFIDAYLSNLKVTQEQSKFTNSISYVVGDDNPFIFLPRISAWDEDDNHVYLKSYVSISTLELKDGETYTVLEGDDLAAVVAIDETASSYDFTEAAVGNTYRLTVKPASDTSFSVSFEFTVVDAWNVYTAKDLSRMDNTNPAWADYKAANSIDNTPISGLAFQNNLALTAADLPADYFHTADSQTLGKEGWMRDKLDLYQHTVADNGTFAIYGNSFTLDVSALPTVAKGDEEAGGYGTDFSNTALFKITGNNYDKTYSGTTAAKIQDLSLIGNACLVTSDAEALDIGLGGIIAFKLKRINATVDNVIVKMTFITYFPEFTTNAEISNCRTFDALQNAIFIWGGANVNLKNGIFKYCGGPAVIAQIERPNDADPESRAPYLTVDEDTVFENPIVGDEVWFANLGLSSTVTQMKDLSANLQFAATTINGACAQYSIPLSVPVLSLTQKNADNIDVMTVLSVLMPEGNAIFGPAIKGGVTMNGANQTNLEGVAALRAKIGAVVGQTAAAQAVIIECNGQLFWTDGTNLYLEHAGNPFTTINDYITAGLGAFLAGGQPDISALAFFEGETLTVHMGSVAIVFETFEVQQ